MVSSGRDALTGPVTICKLQPPSDHKSRSPDRGRIHSLTALVAFTFHEKRVVDRAYPFALCCDKRDTAGCPQCLRTLAAAERVVLLISRHSPCRWGGPHPLIAASRVYWTSGFTIPRHLVMECARAFSQSSADAPPEAPARAASVHGVPGLVFPVFAGMSPRSPMRFLASARSSIHTTKPSPTVAR